jgi:Putative MetA-pathway of phenol degradation
MTTFKVRAAQGLMGLFLMGWSASPSWAEDSSRQSLDEAWWTGPMLAASPKGPGEGHALTETYMYDQVADQSQSLRSYSYLLYGVSDRFTLGLIPIFGFNEANGNHTKFGISDLTFQAQYTVTDFNPDTGMPIIALVLRQSVGTGRYDRLTEATQAFGAGAGATSLGLFSQDYVWLPNGRLLRVRADVLASVSQQAHAQDISVFNTPQGFDGRARPGDAVSLDASLEYSLTRSWVLATDLLYDHGDTTHVDGAVTGNSLRYALGSSDGFGLAPALEYSWAPNWGVLFATRILTAGRNRPASVTPAIALNVVL